MIEFSVAGLRLGEPVLRALLAFAYEPSLERLHLQGIGIDEGEVCASDGHTGLRLKKQTIAEGSEGLKPADYSRTCFSRGLCEQKLKQKDKSQPGVFFAWAEASGHLFPRLGQVEPRDGLKKSEGGWWFFPEYVARLEVAARACRRPRTKDDKALPVLPIAQLVATGENELDPMRWVIGSDDERCAHVAHVTIMPCRSANSHQTGAYEPRRYRARKPARVS